MSEANVSDRAPNVAIRTKPPSPKRLSRKVLLIGAALAGTIVTTALLFGLSPRAPRSVAENATHAPASGPPATIAQAPSMYDAGDFARRDEADLLPPADPFWAGPSAQPAPGGPRADIAQAAPSDAPDPQTLAHRSSIFFASATRAGESNEGADGGRLEARLRPPRSRFELLSGDVIPAALVTGLNSDLPGQVIAQVTAPVYDSVSGQYLLIPQGARLIGAYQSGVSYGDDRILLQWNRLIFPNGWSIDLGDMAGADPTGASGLSDRTDNHLGRLATAIGLSAIVSVIANESEDEGASRDASLSQSIGDAAAQQAAQTGSQIVQRDLAVRPTLRVRPGASVRVLVTRDIALRPYRP